MKKLYAEPEFEVVTLLFDELMNNGVDNSAPENFSDDGTELEL